MFRQAVLAAVEVFHRSSAGTCGTVIYHVENDNELVVVTIFQSRLSRTPNAGLGDSGANRRCGDWPANRPAGSRETMMHAGPGVVWRMKLPLGRRRYVSRGGLTAPSLSGGAPVRRSIR
jgi:hypothetical protein